MRNFLVTDISWDFTDMTPEQVEASGIPDETNILWSDTRYDHCPNDTDDVLPAVIDDIENTYGVCMKDYKIVEIKGGVCKITNR